MGSSPRPPINRGGAPPPRTADRYFEIKSEIHKKLLTALNLERVASIPKDRIRAEIGRVVERLLEQEKIPMTTPNKIALSKKFSTKFSASVPWNRFSRNPPSLIFW